MSASRAARRREQREQAPHVPAEPIPAQWPLWVAFAGFCFACSSLAFKEAFDLWVASNVLWLTLGWGGLFGIAAGSFFLWRKSRSFFKWKKTWVLMIPVILALGVGLGAIWSFWIDGRMEKSQFRTLLDKNDSWLSQLQNRQNGDLFTAEQCLTLRKGQDRWMADIAKKDFAPTPFEIELLASTEKVLYQSGCPSQWERLKKQAFHPPVKWAALYPVRSARAKLAWGRSWPDQTEGCALEQERMKVLKSDPEILKTLQIQCLLAQQATPSPWENFGKFDQISKHTQPKQP